MPKNQGLSHLILNQPAGLYPVPCFLQGSYLLPRMDLLEDGAEFIDADRGIIQQLCTDVDRPGSGVDEGIGFQIVVVVMAVDNPAGKTRSCFSRIMDQVQLSNPMAEYHAGDCPGNYFVMVSCDEMDPPVEV